MVGPSIERPCASKPGQAAHVQRLAVMRFTYIVASMARLLIVACLGAFAPAAFSGDIPARVAFTSVESFEAGYRVIGLASKMSDVADFLAQSNGADDIQVVLEEMSSVSDCKRRMVQFIAVMNESPDASEIHTKEQACAIVTGGTAP